MHGWRNRLRVLAGVMVFFGAGGAALAQTSSGRNELSGHMGFTVGITDTTPGGFRLATEYARMLNQRLWFDVQLNFTLGGDDHWCGPRDARYYCADHFAGDAIEMIAGVKLKFPTGRLLPYAKLGGGIAFAFFGGDHAATALVFRGGGGLKYFVIPQLAIGGELVLSIGPNFVRYGGGTHAYIGLDFLGGVEFVF